MTTSNPNTDGQLGQSDIVIQSDSIYAACIEWDAARNDLAGLAAKQKRAKEAKTNVLGSLDLSRTETQRFVIQKESDNIMGEPMQFAINVSPPGEPRTVEEYEVTPDFSARLSIEE